MKALDIMVSPVITTAPDTSVADVADVLLTNRISGVPVVDEAGTLVGIVSETDLLRRAEAGTERRRSWWLELLTRSDTIAADYVKSHARKVSDIMTRYPVTVTEDTPIADIADLLEARQIKRVPVVRDGKVVGIVSRANLLQAFATMRRKAAPETKADDRTLRLRVLKTIDDAHLPRPFGLNVTVKDGNVDLWGVVGTHDEKKALRVATEVTQGVIGVTDNVVVQPPMSSAI
jgi:CBS domain-containing protein